MSTHVLREYALLADGHRGIVVGPRGDFSWLCAPRWDSPPVLSALVGGPGIYSVSPADVDFVWGGHYEEGSLIWRSRWITTDNAVVECREALAYPGDAQRAVVLRRVQCCEGRARVRAVLDVRADFGTHEMDDLSRSNGTWTARSGDVRVRWTGAAEASRRQGALTLELDLEAGESRDLVLELSDRALPDELPDAELLWEETGNVWKKSMPSMQASIAPRDAQHAYAVLRGMTTPGGGMVAAATTSLPERAEAGRNYDYRYSWIRDQCFAGQAIATDGPHPLLDDAVAFVTARLLQDGARLAPAYTLDGDPAPKQRELEVPGYPGARVRVGNWVRDQFQLDAFGEALLLFSAAARHDRLYAEAWRAAEAAVAAIEKRWQEPDAGVWEIDDEHWTHSRLICAAGLRSLSRQAPARQAAAWESLADTLVADASANSLHPDGHWQRSPRDERVDAALLLPAIRGAVPAGDPRSRATLARIRDELADDYFLYRFRHDERPLEAAEGAFTMCGFDMALALHQQGEQAEALRWFERNRAACGPPGLFSEEYDVRQRQLRGNLPQAFVHALMFEAARRLSEPWPRD
ncbi:MAG: glycoside hydrolase family 15 protein [Nocardioidaceae bacterium]